MAGSLIDTKTTFDNYRKEAERLLLWCSLERGKALSSINHEDWLCYKEFLMDPQPASRWVSLERQKISPFAYALATVCRTAGAGESASGWCNPECAVLVASQRRLPRRKSFGAFTRAQERSAARVTRYLDDDIWAEVKATIDALPRETPREREHYFRLRWLFHSALYLWPTNIRSDRYLDGRLFSQTR